MRWVTRWLLRLYLLIALVRVGEFLALAAIRLRIQLDTFNLESKMVHLAWRAQHGVTLYPEWRRGPFVANFFGPVYFAVVGLIGRWSEASIDGLYTIGRGLTFTSALLATALVVIVLARKYGWGAALLGGCISLGAAPLDGFGVMTRPDVFADTLGFAGFLLVVSRYPARIGLGVCVLALAALTKQTTLMYLLAGFAGLIAQREPRRGWLVLGGTLALLAVSIAVIQFGFEPRFLDDLLGERRTPWDLLGWWNTLSRLVLIGAEVPILSIIGIILWTTGERREPAWAALAIVLLIVSFTTSAKLGADLNYFLGLRLTAALAAGGLWARALQLADAPAGRGWRIALPTVVLVALVAVAAFNTLGWNFQRRQFANLFAIQRGLGQVKVRLYHRMGRLAAKSEIAVLTDAGEIDIHQGARTLFADPWLFRTLSKTHQIDTSRLEARVDNQEFEMILTTHDIFAPTYDSYDFGLPMPVVARVRRSYVSAGFHDGLFVNIPRERPGSAPR